MPQYVEIRVRTHLDLCWSPFFAGLTLTHLSEGETLLAGLLPDQSALFGLLERIRDLNLTLISVSCGVPSKRRSAAQQADSGS